MAKQGIQYFQKYLDLLRSRDLYPAIHTVDGASHTPTVRISGKTFLSFATNNYLGLAGDEDSKQASVAALQKYGLGSGSTRLLSGTLHIQPAFEKELAAFFGFDDAITFS